MALLAAMVSPVKLVPLVLLALLVPKVLLAHKVHLANVALLVHKANAASVPSTVLSTAVCSSRMALDGGKHIVHLISRNRLINLHSLICRRRVLRVK
uniref:Secreted protein n=1 Tax=Panagrellus redivivus TaxID=6233 RepID=A0A7E4W8G4_PANRE